MKDKKPDKEELDLQEKREKDEEKGQDKKVDLEDLEEQENQDDLQSIQSSRYTQTNKCQILQPGLTVWMTRRSRRTCGDGHLTG